MRLHEVLTDVPYQILKGNDQVEIEGICYDSRKAKKGDVYVCLKGVKADGHQYIDDALKRGASAVVISETYDKMDCAGENIVWVEEGRKALSYMSASFFRHPDKQLITIAITGTKGKTTTAYMIYNILNHSKIKTGLIGTVEAINGEVSTQLGNTTPESYEIWRLFREMVDNGLSCVVMEVSSQGLMCGRVEGIHFDYGLFTNLSKDHIGVNEHKNMQEYIYYKSMLFRQCESGILNSDDDYFLDMLKYHTCTVETIGIHKEASFRATNIRRLKNTVFGVSFAVEGAAKGCYRLMMPGEFSVYNSLMAIAVCSHFNVPNQVVARSLAEIRVRGRMEYIETKRCGTVILDYAHNGISLNHILTTLREYGSKKIICLFGCGGNRDKNRRYEMGYEAGRHADLSIITSDNPRWEEPESIIKDIVKGTEAAEGKYVCVTDRKEAIIYALSIMENTDILLLAGKGHEMYQEIMGKKYEMDERKIVEDACAESERHSKNCERNTDMR